MPLRPEPKDPGPTAVLYFPGSEREAVKLPKRAVIIGREKGDIIISDPEISSTHCQIQYVDDAHYLFDMNSSNGTFVNGAKILRHRLNSEDKIIIGKTQLTFLMQDLSKIKDIKPITRSREFLNQDQADRHTIVDTMVREPVLKKGLWQVILKVTYPDKEKEEITLRQNMVYVGRGSSFGRFAKDSRISRKHLMIKINEQGDVFVEDQGSANGTYINGKKIQGIHKVRLLDMITIGSCAITIETIPFDTAAPP